MSLSDTDITNKNTNINVINDKVENEKETINTIIENEEAEEENTATIIENEEAEEENTTTIIENEEAEEENTTTINENEEAEEENTTTIIENEEAEEENTTTTIEAINIKLDNDDLENKQLSPVQKQIITKIFNNAQDVLKELINKPDLNDMLVITITVTNLANLVETIKITNNSGIYSKLSGNDKRKIVLFIGELILSKIISIKNKDSVILLFNTYAESILERIIIFAKKNKTVNIINKQVKNNKCCTIS